MATGFHGFHVIVGTIFLAVCLLRTYQGDFTPEAAFRFRGGRLVLALRRRRVAVPVRLHLRLGRLGRADPRVMAEAPATGAAPSLAAATFQGLCPRCGARTLFAGLARFAPKCRSCGLDFAAFNVGDGPAAFLILIVGAIVAVARSCSTNRISPPWWVHLVWVPVGLGLTHLRPQDRQGSADLSGAQASGTGRAAGRMTRKLPIIPTILVALAVATMIGLGIWQLERRQQKEALLASYAAAAGKPPIGWPAIPPKEPLPLFRAATGNCLSVVGFRTAAGPKRPGRARLPGHCRLPNGSGRAGTFGRARLVEKSQCGPRLPGWAGQRNHRAG